MCGLRDEQLALRVRIKDFAAIALYAAPILLRHVSYALRMQDGPMHMHVEGV